MRPVIFSGTTEGRQISERLSASGIAHIVCVATAYGEIVMEPTPYADIRRGRLSSAEMEELIRSEAGVVLDATHPYAAEVSENICAACRAAGARYVRVLREDDSFADAGDIRTFGSAAECAEALKRTEGNILLTTGSKELAVYAADEGVRSRLFARVLPSEESIRLCADAGLTGRQVIAMQGPFTRAMDRAVIGQYDIRVLVTKASGRNGGFAEKLEAAAEAGIPVYVIGRPAEETGVTADKALEEIFGIEPVMHIDLIGIGPGRRSLMTTEAREAIRRADIICGAARMIEPYIDQEVYPFYRASEIIPLIEERRPGRLAILFSGDTGAYSGAAMMKPELEEWLAGRGWSYELEIHPGISSISYLAAKAGVPWSGAGICSIHGKAGNPVNTRRVIETVRANERTFILMSGSGDVRKLGGLLTENGLAHCTVVLGRQLSYPDEEMITTDPQGCEAITEPGLYAALVLNSMAEKGGKRLTPVIGDEVFIRTKVPMTKENIRHLSVLRLDVREGEAVYDIGSGTGSVACEIASLSPSVKVYAIEMKEEACELTEKNAAMLGLSNIEVVKGRAPEALEALEAPAAVFIGGSSGNLREILKTLAAKAGGIRVVINAVSLETIAEIQAVLREFEITGLNIEQVSVSRSRELGSYHLMTAENPVMIASFRLGGIK